MTEKKELDPPLLAVLLLEDDGSCTPESFWRRLAKLVKACSRGYGFRCRRVRTVVEADAKQEKPA